MAKTASVQRDQREERLDRVFHALSDPTRRALLRRLSVAPEKVTSLAAPFDMSLNAVSKHLKTLEKAGLIERDTQGRTSICSLQRAPLESAQAWLDHYTRFWDETLDALSVHMKHRTGAGDKSEDSGDAEG